MVYIITFQLEKEQSVHKNELHTRTSRISFEQNWVDE